MARHPLNNLDGYDLLLASASPRRRQLMALLNIDFKTVPAIEVDESFPKLSDANDIPLLLSQVKAEAYSSFFRQTANALIVTADTVVILDDVILGKPKNRKEAVSMLMDLSGKKHRVVTGVTISSARHSISFSDITFVTFRQLSEEEILYYVDTYSPFDKAGAYGIQEWIGAVGVENIEGSYFNVMGLPIEALYKHLRDVPYFCE